MRLPFNCVSTRLWMWSGCLGVGLLIALTGSSTPNRTLVAEEAKVASELDRVPTNCSLFAHVRVAEILNGVIGKQIQSGLGKDRAALLKRFEENVGFSLTNIERFTVWVEHFNEDEGPHAGFIFRTTKPYDAEAIKKVWVNPKAKKGSNPELLSVNNSFVLHFTDANTFAIVEKSQAEEYLKAKEHKDQPLKEAFQLARENHAVVWGMNFAALPPEALDENNIQMRPFFPLLKGNTAILIGEVGKDISAKIDLRCKNADSATDALRSWNLLMRLATDGIEFATKDKDLVKELGSALPLLNHAAVVIKEMKVKTDGSHLQIAANIKGDLPYAKLVADAAKTILGVSEAAQESQSINNMKQIALAMHSYHDTNNGFPPQAICDKKGKPLLSWRVAILPYIEQDNLYKQFKLDEAWDSEHKLKLAKIAVKTYMLPGAKLDGEIVKTPYRVFYNNDAAFDVITQTQMRAFSDGLSNTILFIEAAESVPWTKPEDIEFDLKKEMKPFFRVSKDRLTAAFADGSVIRLKKEITEKTIKLLIQRNDGMVVNFDD